MRVNARYYTSTIKRFVSLDPASFCRPESFLTDPQQLNLYSYARNNPVTYNDPSGEWVVPAAGAVVAACARLCPQIAAYFQEEAQWIPMDVADLNSTLSDPQASGWKKLGAAGIFLASTIGPGGGYGHVDEVAESGVKVFKEGVGDSVPMFRGGKLKFREKDFERTARDGYIDPSSYGIPEGVSVNIDPTKVPIGVRTLTIYTSPKSPSTASETTKCSANAEKKRGNGIISIGNQSKLRVYLLIPSVMC